MFDKIKFIFQAKIPVIKLTANSNYNNKKIDITIIDSKHSGLKCVDLILNYIKYFPFIKPIFMVLKQLFFLANLNDPSQVNILLI